jgi:hypothetical protein
MTDESEKERQRAAYQAKLEAARKAEDEDRARAWARNAALRNAPPALPAATTRRRIEPSRKTLLAPGEPLPMAQGRRSGSEKRERAWMMSFRVTKMERDQAREAANRTGLPVGSYLHAKAFGGVPLRALPLPLIERRLLAQGLGHLGQIRSLLNQIARAGNAGYAIDQAKRRAADEALIAMRDLFFEALGRKVDGG